MDDQPGTGGDQSAQSRRLRALFLRSAALCADLIAAPGVAAAWQDPSVLPDLTTGALAGHLSRGILQVEWFLDAGTPAGAAPITAADYYTPPPDASRNSAVRDRGRERAEAGPTAIADEVRDCLERLARRLPGEPPDRLLEARGSSGIRGRVLLLDEYLKVRLVEQVIHGDDLARSVPGTDAEADPAACRIAIGTLVAAATRRHGQMAVLHALARREADTVQALRVL